MDAYLEFEKNLELEFTNKDLLKQAFVHRSYINENKELGVGHNERLEFLGDAVLELVVTDFLYNEYKDVDEGLLTAYRSSLVRTESISEAARSMGMNDLLLLSKGESRDVGKARDYILANTFEAFIGSVYLDLGYDSAKKVISNVLFENIKQVIKDGTWKDSKSNFQEFSQEKFGHTPVYELVSAIGPDHNKNFIMSVSIDGKEIAQGSGNSKQKAQQDAATKALEIESTK